MPFTKLTTPATMLQTTVQLVATAGKFSDNLLWVFEVGARAWVWRELSQC